MDINKLIEGIQKLLEYMFGGKPPEWLLPAIAWGIAIGLFLFSINFILKQLKSIWVELIQPAFYNPEDRRNRLRRQRFADYIESEIRRLNTQEAWSDHRFTELEAEVEAEGRFLWLGLFNLPSIFSKSRLRRESSLSIALEKSPERMILVEGEPGSGKSVALRHVAQRIAQKATRSRNLKQIIPFYINLKGLRREPTQEVNMSLIENYVLSVINRVNDRDVEEYLEDEYRKGIQEGGWFFLFDSFDEIPEVLSSTDSDDTIRLYANAISDFLHSMNQCRGIVASREYRGPRYLDWPKFRILNLSTGRRNELIRKTGLPIKTQNNIRSGLALASQDFRLFASNPMFMNLLCEYMYSHDSEEFPQHVHQVFERYIWNRLSRDKDRISARYGLSTDELRESAEKIAFCINADYGLGLLPEFDDLKSTLDKFGLSLGSKFDAIVNALEYLKLARVEYTTGLEGKKAFTFSHRRFQEYFATSIVIKEPERVSTAELLTNSRWRETAVVILQTKELSNIKDFLGVAINMVNTALDNNTTYANSVKYSQIKHPEEGYRWIPRASLRALFESFSETRKRIQAKIESLKVKPIEYYYQTSQLDTQIQWPTSFSHILGILQDGLRGKQGVLPDETQRKLDIFLIYIAKTGSALDKKLSIEIAGALSPDAYEVVMLEGFETIGNFVRKTAFDRVARYGKLSNQLLTELRITILKMAEENTLFEQRQDLTVLLMRSDQTRYLTSLTSLLAWAPFIDYILAIINIAFLLLLVQYDAISGRVMFLWTLVNIVFAHLRWNTQIIKSIRLSRDEDAQSPSLLLFPVYLWFVVIMLVVFKNDVNTSILYKTPVFYLVLSLNYWTMSLVVETYIGRRISWVWALWYFVFPVYYIFLIVQMLAFMTLFTVTRSWIFIPALWKNKDVIKNNLAEFRIITYMLLRLIIYPAWFLILYVAKILNLNTTYISWGMFGLVWLWVIWLYSKEFWKDYRKYNRWRKSKALLGFDEFAEMVSDYRLSYYRQKTIRDIRTKGLLVINDANIQRVTILIKYVELRLQYPLKIGYDYLEKNDDRTWKLYFSERPSDKAMNSKGTNWTDDQLDELCNLLVFMQSQR